MAPPRRAQTHIERVGRLDSREGYVRIPFLRTIGDVAFAGGAAMILSGILQYLFPCALGVS
mgnify:CR=1 FL=1